MRGCIRVFEDFLDSECKKSNGSAVVDMSLVLSNLAFVSIPLFLFRLWVKTAC
jgi:hypothetical protein